MVIKFSQGHMPLSSTEVDQVFSGYQFRFTTQHVPEQIQLHS